MESEPSFEQACEKFRQFATSLGESRELVWTFREDYIWVNPLLYLVPDKLDENAALVAAIYDANIRRFGVELDLVARNGPLSLCAIWVPESELDAEYRMVNGLKMSVHQRPPEVRIAHPTQRDALRKVARKNRFPGPIAELLSRDQVVTFERF